MAIRVKRSVRGAHKVKATRRRVKGKGSIMVKAHRVGRSTIMAHTSAKSGHGIKKRNSVGRMVYKGHKR